MYKSRIGTPMFYFSVILSVGLIGLSIYMFTVDAAGDQKRAQAFIIAPSVFLLVIIPMLLYPVVKRTAIVTISDSSIKIKYLFKKVILDQTAINSIELNSRKWSSFFDADRCLYGIQIITKEDIKYFIPDIYIASKKTLKHKLENFCADNNIKLVATEVPQSAVRSIPENIEEKFTGAYLLSFNGVLLIAIFAFFILYLPTIPTVPDRAKAVKWISPIGMLIFYFALASQAHCFIIRGNELIIKNHLLFWLNKKYNVDDIRQVGFESRQKGSDFLKVIFKDYSSKRFAAGNLWDKHWDALKKRLTSMNIPVLPRY